MTPELTRKTATWYLTIFIVLTTCMMMTSCAGNKVKFSGYLQDYSELKPYKDGFRWISPDTNFSKYTKIIISPVTFYSGTTLDPQSLAAENINEITQYLHDALVRELSENFEIVDQAGPDVMRIDAAITSVQVRAKDLKAYQYIPVMLVATEAAQVAGLRDKVAVISLEAKVLDSLTGKRIAAVVKSRSEETTVKDVDQLTSQDVKKVLDNWAVVAKDSFLSRR